MDLLIPLPFVIAGVVAALGVGYAFALITTDNRHRKIAAERETRIQHEYAEYKRDVTEHFSQSSRLFSQVTDQYRELYLHMADGARLLGGTPPTPMIERLERERELSRQPRTEPQLHEGGLDDALVELRDDLHQFTTRLESRRKQTKANAKALARRSAKSKRAYSTARPSTGVTTPATSANAPIDLSPDQDEMPILQDATTAASPSPENSTTTQPRARHRSVRNPAESRTPNVIGATQSTPATGVPAVTQKRVRSKPKQTPAKTGAEGRQVLDTNTMRTTTTAKALEDEDVKWQKLVDEWTPKGARV